MNYKLVISRLAVIFLMAMSNVNAEDKVNLNEEVIEGEPDTFFIGKSLDGSLRIKACESCEDLKLRITPETRAYLEGQPVLLKNAAQRTDKPLVVFYDTEKKLATRLHWFTK